MKRKIPRGIKKGIFLNVKKISSFFVKIRRDKTWYPFWLYVRSQVGWEGVSGSVKHPEYREFGGRLVLLTIKLGKNQWRPLLLLR